MVAIIGYGCSSASGQGVQSFWNSLLKGVDHSSPVDNSLWPVSPEVKPVACFWQQSQHKKTALDTLVAQLKSCWQEAVVQINPSEINDIKNNMGIIFASTKGCIEDIIWDVKQNNLQVDSLNPVLQKFVEEERFKPKRSVCVSNACASSHGAFYLGQTWLNQGLVDYVLVVATDLIGPFIFNGFYSLRALCRSKNMPFSADRSGLQLGEAASAVLLAKNKREDSIKLGPVVLDTEGYAITKSDRSGLSLRRIYKKLNLPQIVPDLVIAHGTGTIENDLTEDCVISKMFEASSKKPFVTGTKWCIGHSLGASGSMDLIAGCEVLKKQKVFKLENTICIDKGFSSQYLYKGASNDMSSQLETIDTILINSLGFGGNHASLLINRVL